MSVSTSASLWTLLSLWVLVSASEVQNIRAVPGQTVTLPCRAPRDTDIIVVEWTRPDLETEEYVFLYRDERPDPHKQHPSFQNRVELVDRQMEDGDVSLILKNVKREDTGIYECRVVQRETNRRKRATLDSEPIISIIYLDVRPDQENITADPGQTVTLPCRAPNTNIKAVEWTRPDLKTVFLQPKPATNQSSDSQMKDGDVSLTLKNVTREDRGRYECRVVQRETNRRKRSTLKTEPISIIYLDVPLPEVNLKGVHCTETDPVDT
ncbi:CXADR-like membrane protein isoform X2 [Lates calcarifer]|uniref:CXADR-like membrane protein isoform X2 n=1 Tax=Lates calcarifer TaxID=8187 RepID=A0AAJ8BBB3_LATCA|nr:CXADR-like membrane protein isoform X2 [Lates calcarifer]